MDVASLTLIHRLIDVGSSSLLQYVSESFPWSADPAHAALDAVIALASAEREDSVRLTRYLKKKHLPLSPPATYPSHFTTMNFCSLDFLVPKLIAETEKEIAAVGVGLHSAEDEEARPLIQASLGRKRKQLETLQGLSARS